MRTTVERVRAVDEKLGTHTALLADMQGPKLRVVSDGRGFPTSSPAVNSPFTDGKEEGNSTEAWTNYAHFAEDVKAGEPVLLDDGKLKLRVEETNGKGHRQVHRGARRNPLIQKGPESAFYGHQFAQLDRKGPRGFGLCPQPRGGLGWTELCTDSQPMWWTSSKRIAEAGSPRPRGGQG